MPRSKSNPSHALPPEEDAERDEVLQAFGAAVRKMRLAKRMTIEELAGKAGLDPSYVGGVERGQRNPSLFNVWRLVAALDVPASELMRRLPKGAGRRRGVG